MNTRTDYAMTAAVAAVSAAILNKELGAAIAKLTGATAPDRVARVFSDMLRDPDEVTSPEDVARGLRLFSMGINTRCNGKQKAYDPKIAAVWSTVTLRHDKANNCVVVSEKKTRNGCGASPLERALKLIATATDSELLAAAKATGTESALLDILATIKPAKAESESESESA